MNLLLNDKLIRLDDKYSRQPLLNWLREQQRLAATKEGCGAGDCGACSVLVGQVSAAGLQYSVVNACLIPVGSLDNCHVLTLEGLSSDGLHPIQQAMVEHHASQCGFCTPGIVMALFAWWLNTPANDLSTNALQLQHRHDFTHALSGNLCRCTGYEPIFKVAASLAPTTLGGDLQGQIIAGLSQTEIAGLLTSQLDATGTASGAYLQPIDEQQLALAFDAAPNARLICGNTDVGLEVTQQLQQHEAYIDLSRLSALQFMGELDGELRIGAGVTFSQMEDYFAQHSSPMSEAWLQLLGLIGSRQIRNRGTLGGNIANGSPIADTPPILLALDARIVLQQGTQQRVMPLSDFFIGYRQTALQDNEIIREIRIPRLAVGSELRVAKISKRQEDDISAACIVMCCQLDDDRIVTCRIGLGGMAATPALAQKAADVVAIGGADKAAIMHALRDEFTPLDDVRASAKYRLQVCANTLYYWVQEGGQA